METRVAAIESTLVGIQNGITDFQNRLEGMLTRIDDNDKDIKNKVEANDIALKATLEDKFQTLEKGYTEMCKTLRDEMSNAIGNAVAKMEGEFRNKMDQASAEHIILPAEHQGLETQVMGSESSRIKPMENQVMTVSQIWHAGFSERRSGAYLCN